MLSVVRDMSLYRSRSAAGSGVDDWSAGLLGVGYVDGPADNEIIYMLRATWSSGIARRACTVAFM